MRGHALRSPGSFGSIPNSTKPYENAVHFRSSGTARSQIPRASHRVSARPADMQKFQLRSSVAFCCPGALPRPTIAHAEFTSALLACIPVVSSSLHFAPQANSDN